jgi:hypothetical protein
MAELKIPQTEEPTLLNKDAVIGAGLAQLLTIPLSFVADFVVPGSGSPVAISMITAGGLIGGKIGKTRMEDEVLNGKEVSTPTIFNKTAVAYGFGATFAVGIIATLTAAVALVANSPALMEIAGLPVVGAMLGAPFLGAAYGAFSGKAEMQRDYDQAIENLQSKAKTQSVAIEKAQEVLAGNEPEKANSKSFVAAEDARREHQAVHAR